MMGRDWWPWRRGTQHILLSLRAGEGPSLKCS